MGPRAPITNAATVEGKKGVTSDLGEATLAENMSQFPHENPPGSPILRAEPLGSDFGRPSSSGPSRPALRIGPLTATLIGLSVVATLACNFGNNRSVLERLLISDYIRVGFKVFLPEVEHGQVWRLVTPIFIHFGLLHIVFNMMWLKDLGTAIEKVMGPRVLVGLVLVTGILSNVGQYLASGPVFGGMSGVVYALLGYLWMKSRYDPASGFVVPRQIVLWMLGWLVLCMTGLVGNVANYAHGVGLVAGVVWGRISAAASQWRAGNGWG